MLCPTVATGGNVSIFMLGDSVTERIYVDGFLPVFNCSVVDPKITRNIESVDNYYQHNKGMLCSQYNITRVGYQFHWGVARTEGDYHVGWQKHRTANDTNNSHHNIIAGIKEFQSRSSNDK